MSWGFGWTAGPAILSPTARSSSADIGVPCFSKLSCRTDGQSLPLPPTFSASSGTLTLAGCEFILYMDHLEPLTESNNNQQRAPGIAKLDLLGFLFFPSLKDPLIGQNQFQTASVPRARLSRHCLSPASQCEPNGLPGANGEAGCSPSQTPHFVQVIIAAGGHYSEGSLLPWL